MKIANSLRLAFEMIGHDDAELLFELDQDPEVMRYINGGKPTTMEELQTVILPRLDAYFNPEKGWGLWKVTTLASETDLASTFIGWILVRPMDFFSEAPKYHDIELGWRFKRCSWGKGYATEAAKAIAEHIAKQASVTYLSAVADKDNLGSINIMKKLGMAFTKTDDYSTPNGAVIVSYYQMPARAL
jgi:RimJ/RimL family protein N-acetyltransferase